MADDDEMPELEDLSNDLAKIRIMQGRTDETSGKDTEIKVNVIENKSSTSTSTSNTTTSIPIENSNDDKSKTEVKKSEITTVPVKKSNEDDFGKGFKRGFFRKEQNTKPQPQQSTQKQSQSQPQQKSIEDLTHIKSTPGTTIKNQTVETFNKNLKESLPQQTAGGLMDNIANKKDEWLNQELLMKIAKNPNLMKCFMDPRFSVVIQEMQRNPKDCMEKYGNNPEFSTFIKDFSLIMGSHFTNLANEKNNVPGGNPNMNTPEVQAVLNDPKVIPFLTKLQKEGKIDIDELNKDPYLASKVKFLVDKKILNIQKMD